MIDLISAEYEALAIAEAEEKADYGLPKEVLQTMSNYSSPSDGRVPSNVALWDWYGITPPGSSTSHMSPSFLQAEVNYQQAMVKHAQEQNEALQVELMASERANEEIYKLLSFQLPILWYVWSTTN